MNVLILTPDAVGSTLLQRLITIYMQFHQFDKPVINLHELSNGLVKYYNPDFNQDVLGKKYGKWGYYQSLEEIVELLNSVDHYKTSRLAQYHLKNRQDPIEQQIPFYQYLNDNFFIISCRRHNVFEHSLSWCLSKITKKLNVFTSKEKIDSFFELYKNGIDLDPNSLLQTLNAYRDYLDWCNSHFSVANYFYYDEHLPNIENYILNLPIFAQRPRLTWKDNFDIDFNSWNQCHRTPSDLGNALLAAPEKFAQLSHNSNETTQQVEKHNELLPTTSVSTQSIINLLPDTQKEFFNENNATYQTAMAKIHSMVDSGVMLKPPPIKKQTLAEKKRMIRNYRQLLDVYNQWIEQNSEIGKPIDEVTLDSFAQAELNYWDPTNLKNQLSVDKNFD